MTEVVTSLAASSQLNLLAQRQQVLVVVRQGVDANAATAAGANASAQSQTASDTQNSVNHHQDQTLQRPDAQPISGPSRPRIELKTIDLGLTPSEVVGTPDVLQRFDRNGDGHIDQSEAARAGVTRQGVFTYAGLASDGVASDQTPAPPPQTSTPTPAETTDISTAPPPDATSTPDAGAPATIADSTTKKLYGDAAVNDPGKKLYTAASLAELGAPTGTVDAPKKFYGQGTEAVVGKFVVEKTQRFVEKQPLKVALVAAEGETKLYDKVPHVETGGQGGTENQNTNPDTHAASAAERARQLAAQSLQAGRTVLVEVSAYDNASTIIDTTTPDAPDATTVVTA